MVERAIMSIINKMHQGLQDDSDSAPILASMPDKKHKQKVFFFCLISLLLISSIGLSYLIYNKLGKRNHIAEETSATVSLISKAKAATKMSNLANATPTEPRVVITPSPLQESEEMVTKAVKNILTATVALNVVPDEKAKPDLVKKNTKPLTVIDQSKPDLVKKKTKTVIAINARKSLAIKEKAVTAEAKKPEKGNTPYLEIKTSTLTKQQLADIHLKKAQKALSNGDSLLASQEKSKALNIKPELHEVRKSLALYHYAVGDINRAKSLLKKGAIQFSEYSDFNLMLSRIALKNGEQQKAYLYLNQNPPKVKGHLDYHVSYAILAQKFEKYVQAEKLYLGLLSQWPNNGRWIMSLAIAQDKLNKKSLAMASYQKALLQIDLSSKAKKYINQRLTYLGNQ